ncbi:YdcF family protein [Thermoflavimicrobium daqui]|uniref:YdcF family protein n=1 Tax=Thermoflavimicrobium daqui TaxID=2137476 RepID=A0A364K1T3_9BACL|nr:YdcF family protein [Thermoflavimicrobium daqui]RAL21893.1 YdcF family protein [Thermoflavimicrobium daqui]
MFIAKLAEHKWLIYVVIGLIVVGIFTLLFFWSQVSRFDEVETNEEKRDAAIILGAAVWKDQPSPALKERLDKGAELYKKGWVQYLILSGGKGTLKLKSEAMVMKDYLVQQGVQEEHLILEDQSTNTRENLKNTKLLLEKRKLDQLYLITHDYHMHRSLQYAEHAGITAAPSPVHSKVLFMPYHKSRECFALVKLNLFDS